MYTPVLTVQLRMHAPGLLGAGRQLSLHTDQGGQHRAYPPAPWGALAPRWPAPPAAHGAGYQLQYTPGRRPWPSCCHDALAVIVNAGTWAALYVCVMS